jgi:steroid 5-alpha reductase family enzyme
MNFLNIILFPLGLIHIAYLIAIFKKDFSIIDSFWGLGFILLSLAATAHHSFDNQRELLLLFLISVWGLRLSLFIYIRNHGKGEDFRYTQWRRKWGRQANIIAYFKIYLLQYLLMILVGLPIFAAHLSSTPLNGFDFIGTTFFCFGLFWEVIADYQKSHFKGQPGNSDRICQTGLWFYSRHPNYFGETTLWWGLGIIGAAGGYWWSLIGSAFINFLLLKITGVPLLEARYKGNLEWDDYKKTTPALLPNLMKK